MQGFQAESSGNRAAINLHNVGDIGSITALESRPGIQEFSASIPVDTQGHHFNRISHLQELMAATFAAINVNLV